MDPVQTSDLLLTFIKSSNLNYNLTESPFSVSINIRKTFIRDKDGTLKTPFQTSNYSNGYHLATKADTTQISLLEAEIESLKAAVNQHEIQQDDLMKANHELDSKLQAAKLEISDILFKKNELEKAKEAIEMRRILTRRNPKVLS